MRKKDYRSRPYSAQRRLCRSALNRVTDLVPCCVINDQVVLLAAVLLHFGHDFLFTIAPDLSVAVFRTQIGAAEV